MYLPLPINTVLNGRYTLMVHMCRVYDHNLYIVSELSSGEKKLVNEFIPEYCIRGEDGQITTETANKAKLFGRTLKTIEKDTDLIKNSPLNERYYIEDSFNENGSVYIVCSFNECSSVAQSVEQNHSMSFGYIVDLTIMLCELAKYALANHITSFPDKESVFIGTDGFSICYHSLTGIKAKKVKAKLAELFYYMLVRSDYEPDAPDRYEINDDSPEGAKQRVVFDLIISVLNGENKDNLEKFRSKLYSAYFPSTDGPPADKQKVSAKKPIVRQKPIPKKQLCALAGFLLAVMMLAAIVVYFLSGLIMPINSGHADSDSPVKNVITDQ